MRFLFVFIFLIGAMQLLDAQIAYPDNRQYGDNDLQ